MILNGYIYDDLNTFNKIKENGIDILKFYDEVFSPTYQALTLYFNNNKKEIKKIRICVISEDYISWTKQNNKNISKESINKYITHLSDEEITYLWEKYKKNINYNLYSIPFGLISNNINKIEHFQLNNKLINNLKESIHKTTRINRYQIYIPELILTTKNIKNYYEDIIDNCIDFFKKENVEVLDKLKEQEFDINRNIFLLNIPVVITNFNSPFFDKKKIEKLLKEKESIFKINKKYIDTIIQSYFMEYSAITFVLSERLILPLMLKEIEHNLFDSIIKIQKTKKKIKRSNNIFNNFNKKD